MGYASGTRLGVDVGSVRVGLAGSDPRGLIATPIATLARDLVTAGAVDGGAGPDATGTGGTGAGGAGAPGADHDGSGEGLPADVARIVSEVCERGATIVYVGLPVHLSGAEGSASAAARAYAGTLVQAVHPVEVRLVDERMSTVAAHQAMRAAGRPGRRQRAVVDQVAAVLILQSALDAERSTGSAPGEQVEVQP